MQRPWEFGRAPAFAFLLRENTKNKEFPAKNAEEPFFSLPYALSAAQPCALCVKIFQYLYLKSKCRDPGILPVTLKRCGSLFYIFNLLTHSMTGQWCILTV